jgi:hypothetical protein
MGPVINSMNDSLNVLRGDLERLRRHYDHAVSAYDEIALADMSHMLRMWTEMKFRLAIEIPGLSGSREFKIASPTKKVVRILKGNEFVLSYLPGGAITYAAKGELSLLPESWNQDPQSQSILAKFNQQISMEMASFCVVKKLLDDEQLAHLRSCDNKRVGYQEWLDSDAVRVGMRDQNGDIKIISIPRDVLIKRIANKHHGSHSRLNNQDGEWESKFDPCIVHLMDFRLGGLPLPYFILLKAAQDILSVVGSKIEAMPRQSV